MYGLQHDPGGRWAWPALLRRGASLRRGGGPCGEGEAGSGVAGPPAAGSGREAAWGGGGDAGTRAGCRGARCTAPMVAADLEVGATGDEASAAGPRAFGEVAAQAVARGGGAPRFR